MAPNRNIPGQGDVIITLGGREYVLRSTARAAMAISRTSGGIRGAIDAILKMDLDVIMNVVRTGLGPNAVREIGGDFEDIVWQEGLTDANGALVARCIEYCHVLANGGRPVTVRDDQPTDPQQPTVQ